MKKETLISQIMTTQLISIQEMDSLEHARKLFETNKIRHILVLKDSKLVGILSNHDLLRISFGDTYGDDQTNMDDAIVNMLSVKDVMRHDPIFVSSKSTIEDAIYILLNRRFHSLPVVDKGEVVGIVTTTDFLRLLI
ncbi:MAG: CBS domain-containing protein [Flavobacteriales bacterium]|nr:CBS domain-containing protein [Flavobacteriales bacterium]